MIDKQRKTFLKRVAKRIWKLEQEGSVENHFNVEEMDNIINSNQLSSEELIWVDDYIMKMWVDE